MRPRSTTLLAALLLTLAGLCPAGELPANQWVQLKDADIGQRSCEALVYSPEAGLRPGEAGRFLTLGGYPFLGWGPRSEQPYADLALDLAEGKWENWYPVGKSFGPKFGPCQPPKFKGYDGNVFTDDEGNSRVNPNALMWGAVYGLSAYDTDAKRIYFHGDGNTWWYEPASRKWEPVKTATHPARTGGTLFWGSMCYDAEHKRFVLFGGGNVQTERGDPGTWTFDPAEKQWAELKLDKQPPPRANSQLLYDPASKKVVLFGGDGLDRLYADTWTFDGQKWEEKKPAVSPSPRAGHALLWLPKAKKILLLGGYQYDSKGDYGGGYYKSMPIEVWIYDVAADRWEFLKRFETGKEVSPNCNFGCGFINYLVTRVAVNPDDVLAMVQPGNPASQTWLCRLDSSQADAAGTAKYGVKPDTVERRTAFYDPKWYTEGVPPADPAKVKTELDALPANTWVLRNPPKVPRPNMDWGSAVFLPKADRIARFSGGHSSYSGTAPHFYDVKTDRWSMPFAPDVPPGWQGHYRGIIGEWSFNGNPWMPGHTWRATGSDPAGERLIYIGYAYTYSVGPQDSKWSRGVERHPGHDVRATTLCTTRDALIAWAIDESRSGSALYRVDPVTGAWKKLPVTGTTLPRAVGFDFGGLSWDSKRDRLLIFSPQEKGHEGDVMSYDLKTGEAKWLMSDGRAGCVGPAGEDSRPGCAVPARETVYLPEHDMVLLCAHAKLGDGKTGWPLYDCGKNAWFGAAFAGPDPISSGKCGMRYNRINLGMVCDPDRRLVWVVGQYDELSVLRFDPKTAGLVEFK